MATQPRAAETRRRILAAAVDLFAANGYLETTPQAIAAAADLTTGAFYYHFKSKEDLATAIVDEGWPDVAAAFNDRDHAQRSGLLNVIESVFAVTEILNHDKLRWVGFHLNMAIGHLSPSARQSYRERVQAFSLAVVGAFQDSQLREGVTRQRAGELLWITLSGSQLLSDVLESTPTARFARLGAAWKSVLRTIVPDSALPELVTFIDQTVARYGQTSAGEPATVYESVTESWP